LGYSRDIYQLTTFIEIYELVAIGEEGFRSTKPQSCINEVEIIHFVQNSVDLARLRILVQDLLGYFSKPILPLHFPSG